MKHARPDYQRIQDPEGIIPENEPVFLLRAKDKAAPDTIRFWARLAKVQGAADDIVEAALDQAERMEQYADVHYDGGFVPDMPKAGGGQ